MPPLDPGKEGDSSAAPVAVEPVAELFRRLFRTEHAYVFHSLRRLRIPERDLADVTHDVFVVVHRKLPDYDASRPARPWLLAIAARVASDYRRLARNRNERIDGGELPPARDPGPDAEAALEASEAQAMVIEALQAVDETRRALLVMVDIDGIAVPEAAAALGLPLNTAYSRLRKARAELTDAARRLRFRRGDA